MVRRSRSSSPDSKTSTSAASGLCPPFRPKPKKSTPEITQLDDTNSEISTTANTPPPQNVSSQQSLRSMPKKQEAYETVAETDSSDLPMKSLAVIRQSLQSLTSQCEAPCNQSAAPPPPLPIQRNCDPSNSFRRCPPKNTQPLSECMEAPKPTSRQALPQLEKTYPAALNPMDDGGKNLRPKHRKIRTDRKTRYDTSIESSPVETQPRSLEYMRQNMQSIIDSSLGDVALDYDPSCTCEKSRLASFSPVETSNFDCKPTSWPATIEKGYPAPPYETYVQSTYPVKLEESYPRGPSNCICDPTQCPVPPVSYSEPYVSDAVYPPPAPLEANCGCNHQFPEDDCPCACASGPDSTCITKRTAFQRFRGIVSRVVEPMRASLTGQSQYQNQMYTYQQDCPPDCSPNPIPRQLVFKLVESMPARPPPRKPPPPPRKMLRREEKVERLATVTPNKSSYDRYVNNVEVYYFDHGNSGYYRTTDNPPPLITDEFLERSDRYATEFWANIFGVLHVGISYLTIFFIQLFRFVCYSLIRAPIVGFIQIVADYLIKPILSIFFNGIFQPIFIFFFNVATSFRDFCEPLARAIGYFFREFAQICRAFRLVEMNTVHSPCTGSQAKISKRVSTQTKCEPCGEII